MIYTFATRNILSDSWSTAIAAVEGPTTDMPGLYETWMMAKSQTNTEPLDILDFITYLVEHGYKKMEHQTIDIFPLSNPIA